MKELLNKYLTIKNRNIIAIVVIILGIGFIVNYSFFEPTYINKYIATKVYNEPANSYFDDQNFYNCVIDNYNRLNSTNVSYTTNLSNTKLKTIYNMTCTVAYDEKITSLKGLEKLTGLKSLSLGAQGVSSVDVSSNVLLERLYLFEMPQVVILNVSNNTLLETLSIQRTQISVLDLSNNINLKSLSLYSNQILNIDLDNNILLERLDISAGGCVYNSDVCYPKLSELNVSNNVNLKELKISGGLFTELDLSNNTKLERLDAYSNQLTSLDLSNNTNLTDLNVSSNKLTNLILGEKKLMKTLVVSHNQLTELDVSGATALETLTTYGNELTNLDLDNNRNLINLYLSWSVYNNNLTKLSLINNKKLVNLNVFNNQLTELDVSNATELEKLNASGNNLVKLDVSGCSSLKELSVYNNQLTELDVSNATELEKLNASGNNLVKLDVSGCSSLKELSVYNNQLTELDVSSAVELEMLEVFRNKLTSLDVNNCSSLKKLVIYNNQLTKFDVSKNTMLTDLRLQDNKLTSLDVSNNIALTSLDVAQNQLTSLDVSNNIELTSLDVAKNQLTSLDVSNNIALTSLDVAQNQLTSLDVSNNIALTSLDVAQNQLTSLDVSNNIALTSLDVAQNQLTSLNVNNNIALTSLDVAKNQLTSLDVSNNTNLTNLNVRSNKLTSLDVAKNWELKTLLISENPFCEKKFVYIGSNVILGNNVNLPVHLNWSSPTWTSNNGKVASVDQTGVVTTLKSGSVEIEGVVSSKYRTTSTVNVVEITSEKYIIDEENVYILVGSDKNVDVIKNNINISHEGVDLDIDFDNYKLYVKYGDEVLKEFDIVGFDSEKYDLSKDYIYVGSDELDLSKITTTNCTKKIEGDKLVIKVGKELVKEYNLISVSSDKYNLNNSYIYIGSSEFDIDSINVVNGNKDVINDKLVIKYEQDVVAEYNLLSISSDKVIIDEENNYIYLGIFWFGDNNGSSDFKFSDGITFESENNKMFVIYNEKVIKEYDTGCLFSSNNSYVIGEDYIYVGSEQFSLDKLFKSNCSYELIDNRLIVKYKDAIYAEYNIISIESVEYDLSNEYIYTGVEKFDLDGIDVVNCDKELVDNKVVIQYNDEVLDEYIIVSVLSDKYDLSKNNIYTGYNNVDINSIDVINGSVEVIDNRLVIKYNDDILDEFELLNIKINNYVIYDKNILVTEDVSFEDFISDIEVGNGITYSLYNGEEEVTGGNVLVDYVLKIYYNDIEIDEYIITDENEYLEFDNSLYIDYDNSVINNIKSGTNIEDITSKIDTNGIVSVLDKTGNVVVDTSNKKIGTGYKFKIEFPSQTLHYIISVRGDVTSDGIVNINDVIGVSRHVIKGNYLEGIEYINASDIDGDNKVNINDVIRLAKHIVNKSEL